MILGVILGFCRKIEVKKSAVLSTLEFPLLHSYALSIHFPIPFFGALYNLSDDLVEFICR